MFRLIIIQSHTLLYSIIAFFLLILTSCNESNDESKGLKTIHLKESKDVLPISNFIRNVEYVEIIFPKNEIILGEIRDLKVIEKDLILKQHKAKTSSLLRFSKKGVFQNFIGDNRGEAFDIINPKDVIFYNGNYAVWDEKGVHAITKTGQYKNELLKTDLPGNNFFSTGNNFFLFHETTSPGYLSRYTETGVHGKVYLPNTYQFENLGYSDISQFLKDSVHLFSPLNDTIYSFSKNFLRPKYILNGESFPTYFQMLKTAGEKNRAETLKFMNTTQHVVVKKFLENKNFIFIAYRIGSISYNQLIEKKNWETTYFKKCINDIDGGIWGDPYFLSEGDVLYIPLNSYKISGHKVLNKRNKAFEDLKLQAESSSNPVIMKCKLRK